MKTTLSKNKKTKARRTTKAIGCNRMSGRFRVYVGQVNQTYVDVTAKDRYEASDKGYRLWRREYAHSEVMSVESMTPEAEKPKTRCPVEFENAELRDEG